VESTAKESLLLLALSKALRGGSQARCGKKICLCIIQTMPEAGLQAVELLYDHHHKTQRIPWYYAGAQAGDTLGPSPSLHSRKRCPRVNSATCAQQRHQPDSRQPLPLGASHLGSSRHRAPASATVCAPAAAPASGRALSAPGRPAADRSGGGGGQRAGRRRGRPDRVWLG